MDNPRPNPPPSPNDLSTISSKDVNFDIHKTNSREISRLYDLDDDQGFVGFFSGERQILFSNYAKKLYFCGDYLSFAQTDKEIKLTDARFCKNPLCPMCAWRRALKWRARMLSILPIIQDDRPAARWLFLTLTIKNCDINDLKSTVSRLNQSFQRLQRSKFFPFVGYVKSLEITRTYDCYDAKTGDFVGRHGSKWIFPYERKHGTQLRLEATSEVHPHLHIVGIVQPCYFKSGYLSQKKWTELWQNALKSDYVPIVNVKAVRCRLGASQENLALDAEDKKSLVGSICETLKYVVKESDLVGSSFSSDQENSLWLKCLTEQIYRLRKVEYRGIFKEYAKLLDDSDNDDLINVDDKKDETEESNIILQELTFKWEQTLKRYVQLSRDDSGEDSED